MSLRLLSNLSGSRRDFLRQLGRLGSVVPASLLLTGLHDATALQRSPASPASRKPQSSPGHAARFSFTDISARAGLGGAINVFGGVTHKRLLLEETGCGVALFDYDNDGWLDIFMVNGTRFEGISAQHQPANFLFHNNRDGSFTDVTEKTGLIRSGWGQGCCVGDYDNDGYDDLVVTYWGAIVLYHNNGDGTVTGVTQKAGLVQNGPAPRWNTGCCFVDYDRDGHLDLFVANYVNFDPRVAPQPGENQYCRYYGLSVGCGPQGMSGGTNILYRNRGDGTFEDVSERSGVSVPRGSTAPTSVSNQWVPAGSYGLGVCAADFDNDGWPDIFMSNGHVFPTVDTKRLHVTFKQGKTVYKNLGNGSFTDVTSSAGPGVTQPHSSRGTAFGDFDNDGDVDVAVLNMNEAPSLLRNDCSSRNNWLKVKCIGTKSNRSAVGARVRVVTGRHSQINEVMSGSSYMSQNDFRLHFGLGRAKQADLVEVQWPLGLMESFKNVSVNQLLVIQEGRGIIRRDQFGKR